MKFLSLGRSLGVVVARDPAVKRLFELSSRNIVRLCVAASPIFVAILMSWLKKRKL